MKLVRSMALRAIACLLAATGAARAADNTFTYQGELTLEGARVDGLHDIRLTILDAQESELQILCADNVPVTDGRFTLLVDPGSEFPFLMAQATSVRISVRTDTGLNCADDSNFVSLSPPQPFSASPRASRSTYAESSGSASALAGLSPTYYTNAANLTGILPDSSLSPNVPLLSQENTFSGTTNTFGNIQSNGWIGSETNSVQLRSFGQRALFITRNGGDPMITMGSPTNTITPGSSGANILGGLGQRSNGIYTTIAGGSNNVLGTTGPSIITNQYSVISGGAFNEMQFSQSSVIAGGYLNRAYADFASVGGGERNQVLARYGTISGGGPSNPADGSNTNNRIWDDYGTIGGGGYNRAGDGLGLTSDRPFATVAGGSNGRAEGGYSFIGGGNFNQATGTHAAVAGGFSNVASGLNSIIGGGILNAASGERSAIGGGNDNRAAQLNATIAGGSNNFSNANYASIGGGISNTASGERSAIGGGSDNRAAQLNSTVSGGSNNFSNANYSSIGGGISNTTAAQYATIGGGSGNNAGSGYSTIGGGVNNVTSGGGFATIAGGSENDSTGFVSTIGGGDFNLASGERSTIGGGNGNFATGRLSALTGGFQNRADAEYSGVGAGSGNRATANYAYVAGGNSNHATFPESFIGGGRVNRANNETSAILGGVNNTAAGISSSIGGGEFNGAAGNYSTVAGGYFNAANGQYAVAMGGNNAFASGDYSVSAGGFANRATAAHAFAAGKYAYANHAGSFVWADSLRQFNTPVESTGPNQFIIMAAGGVCISTTGPTIRAPENGGLSELSVGGEITAFLKFFRIDHPLDPANKELLHACVESDEYKNIYDGIVTTDSQGFATVTMPDWFSALNESFRYQLTVIDESDNDFIFAKIARKLGTEAPNTFTIKTSVPNTQVSWQVTGNRKDAFAKARPMTVEVDKPADRRGTYLFPQGFTPKTDSTPANAAN